MRLDGASPGPIPPGVILVGDHVVDRDGTVTPCPAAPLLAADLRRRGAQCQRGVIDLRAENQDISWSGGLAVATRATDRAARVTAHAAVTTWLAATGPRTVLLAAPRSFCAGVERAIQTVEKALEATEGPVYVRKQIVHNTHVVTTLTTQGAIFVDDLHEVPDGATVVFSAHGVSPAVRSEATTRNMTVIDATCPLVAKVHTETRRYATRGDTILLIGHAGHEEVEGTLGEAPTSTILVQSVAEAEKVKVPDPRRVTYLTQTTLAVDETADIIATLQNRFPHLTPPPTDDICYATTNRQEALKAIATTADLILVIGSPNSSNTQRLVELATRTTTPTHLIEDLRDIHPHWLIGTTTIGLTAGASAPPHLVEATVEALKGLGPLTVAEHQTAQETITFTLPSPVRRT